MITTSWTADAPRRPHRRPRRNRTPRPTRRPADTARPGLQPARHRPTTHPPGTAGRRRTPRTQHRGRRPQGIPDLPRPPHPTTPGLTSTQRAEPALYQRVTPYPPEIRPILRRPHVARRPDNSSVAHSGPPIHEPTTASGRRASWLAIHRSASVTVPFRRSATQQGGVSVTGVRDTLPGPPAVTHTAMEPAR